VTTATSLAKRRARNNWLVRGALGAALLAVALSSREPVVVLPAVAAALIAFRGCPGCWAFGLLEHVSKDVASPSRKEKP
jgi:hypothetical protein